MKTGLSTNALRRKGRGNQELVSAPWVVCEAVSEAGVTNHKQKDITAFLVLLAKPYLARLHPIDTYSKGFCFWPVFPHMEAL